jgi:GNAT superfamily N-acetyltransferase
VTLTDGSDVLVRPACARDAQLLAEMHRRCSTDTLHLRYFSITYELSEALLPSLLGLRPGALALVAETPNGIVALANLFTADNVSGETALLVEDAWQRRGLGTALARILFALADDYDLRVLTAVTMHANPGPFRP